MRCKRKPPSITNLSFDDIWTSHSCKIEYSLDFLNFRRIVTRVLVDILEKLRVNFMKILKKLEDNFGTFEELKLEVVFKRSVA